MDIRKKIGIRIKELRKSNNLTQEKLGLIANIDRTYITSVENGKRNISIVNIEKLCLGLNISIKDFFNSPLFKNKKE